MSWIVSEVSPRFALFQICECLFSRFVVSSYGRGFADNLYDKSLFLESIVTSAVGEISDSVVGINYPAESRIRVIQVFMFTVIYVF